VTAARCAETSPPSRRAEALVTHGAAGPTGVSRGRRCTSMPVELLLECVCHGTEFGDELFVVGDHPSLGAWDTSRAIPLVTEPGSFPKWSLRSPLLLSDDPADLPGWLEYKYVIRRIDGSVQWEDLGSKSIPTFSSTAAATTNFRILASFVETTQNRRLPSRNLLNAAHAVLLRIDGFGRFAPVAEAAWRVPKTWAPHLAGGDTDIGLALFNSACRASVCFDGLEPCDPRALRACAEEVLLSACRRRLTAVVRQVRSRHWLPLQLWRLIGEFVDGAAES